MLIYLLECPYRLALTYVQGFNYKDSFNEILRVFLLSLYNVYRLMCLCDVFL